MIQKEYSSLYSEGIISKSRRYTNLKALEENPYIKHIIDKDGERLSREMEYQIRCALFAPPEVLFSKMNKVEEYLYSTVKSTSMKLALFGLTRHNIMVTGEFSPFSEIRIIDNHMLHEGELVACQFMVGNFLVRSAAKALFSKPEKNNEQQVLRVSHVISAKYIDKDKRTSFVRICDSSGMWNYISPCIISCKKNMFASQDKTALILESFYAGSSWQCTSYIALFPNGEISCFETPSRSDDSEYWNLFDS